jgi:xanthine dehydrogenase FAD-binding subunit
MFDIAKYQEAQSVPEAIALLQENTKARIIAGGTDILIKIRHGGLPDAELVGIQGIAELTGVSRNADGDIRIGACTSFAKIAAHPVVRRYMPVLAEAADTVGGPQIRHVATIGGNICNGATSADSASTLLVLNAQLCIEGPRGMRITSLREFYQGPGRVNLEHGEILSAILITSDNYRGFGGHYIKYAMRNAMDIATLGCAVLCKVDQQQRIEDFRLAFGVAAPTPIRCPRAEAVAIGQFFSETLLYEAGKAATMEVNPRSSWRASREFRIHLVEELSKRAFRTAVARAGGEEK